jgi:hypothetical protein
LEWQETHIQNNSFHLQKKAELERVLSDLKFIQVNLTNIYYKVLLFKVKLKQDSGFNQGVEDTMALYYRASLF